jgi:hypothetical protein
MKGVMIAAISMLLGGCASLPPILERWADLEIATQSFYREGSNPREFLSFYKDGRVDVKWDGVATEDVRWRVRGAWLEMDTDNDGTYKLRLRAVSWTKDQIVAASPEGKRSVWRRGAVVVSIGPLPQRPGLWMP